jgi:hypothetical protein
MSKCTCPRCAPPPVTDALAFHTARAFRLALAMDRIAQMRADVSAMGARGFIWTSLEAPETFSPDNADEMAEAVARMWARCEAATAAETERKGTVNDQEE